MRRAPLYAFCSGGRRCPEWSIFHPVGRRGTTPKLRRSPIACKSLGLGGEGIGCKSLGLRAVFFESARGLNPTCAQINGFSSIMGRASRRGQAPDKPSILTPPSKFDRHRPDLQRFSFMARNERPMYVLCRPRVSRPRGTNSGERPWSLRLCARFFRHCCSSVVPFQPAEHQSPSRPPRRPPSRQLPPYVHPRRRRCAT